MPAASQVANAEPAWPQIEAALGLHGVASESLYTVTLTRDDLEVRIEGMDVPPAAGLQSTFWFYRCPCGKMNLTGQFIVADYEANDVVDALRAGNLKIAAIGPALLYEKPRLSLIRFQGEGEAAALAKTLREAIRWTGKERMAPRKMD